MTRLKFIMVLACLMLLSGCSRSDQDTVDKVPESSEYQTDSSNTLPQPVSEMPDKDTIENNTTLYNYIETVIDEVRLVNGSTSLILAENMQPGDSVLAQWDTAEQDLSEQGGESPYFILVVSGQEIPITVARLADKEMYEELYLNLDEIAFFHTDGVYYFSPQADYLDREKSPGTGNVPTQYLYLPQVQRWLQQREGQLLFAVGLAEEEIHAYFPEYKDDIPLTTCAAMISCETIYLEDVHVEVATESGMVTEIRESDELQIFTTDDVIVIPVDHVRFPDLYFRYQDAQGNVHRQYVMDQSRDDNNGTITSHMLTSDDEYYELVPVESHESRDYSMEANPS